MHFLAEKPRQAVLSKRSPCLHARHMSLWGGRIVLGVFLVEAQNLCRILECTSHALVTHVTLGMQHVADFKTSTYVESSYLIKQSGMSSVVST